MGSASGTMPGSPMAWGATQAEWDRHYTSDDHLRPGWIRMLRAVSCAAPPEAVWPWLCQIQVAPYSYDLLDNRGRRSPRSLTPGLTDLTVGQDFMTIFRLEEFAAGSRLTLSMKPGAPTRMFGAGWITYAVEPAGRGSRLVGALAFPRRRGLLGAVSNALLPWGDLVMMRKQLRTLAGLAGTQAAPRLEPSLPGMRASSVRIIATFGLLLALAASAHWIGGGPDPAPTSHRASTVVSTQPGQR